MSIVGKSFVAFPAKVRRWPHATLFRDYQLNFTLKNTVCTTDALSCAPLLLTVTFTPESRSMREFVSLALEELPVNKAVSQSTALKAPLPAGINTSATRPLAVVDLVLPDHWQ